MTQETLEKANELSQRLKFCRENLDSIKYTQDENISWRECYLKCRGTEGSVEVPNTLIRTIGKLIQSEYLQKISELQKELDEL